VRPSLPLSVAFERSHGKDDVRARLHASWTRGVEAGEEAPLLEALRETGAEQRCRSLLDGYKEEAVRCLADVENPSLKGLLRRIVGKIFNELEIKGWCSERQAGDAAGREARAEAAQ
jgi:hypothetical protein